MKKEKRAVQKYQPSNDTEGGCFMIKFCDNCMYENEDENFGCDILFASMCYDIGDSEYPEEWQYGEDGQPLCTKFKQVVYVEDE